ncbi:ParB N-terminal domain-containing protein [Anaeromicropila populeti]|uniref:ParB/RepB/Spo0J family partition protein n=1 Tax=Anaeromicropila populeti TaxID=37658 RepID=A0A1I6I6Z0_9FIRM|nr:ParB N-terminal domain-containing protein [Anaeromicropila populeti]SFR62502.1 ParB/RepB/Spo0J family partition protein [Anaeromicropila populeti]
MLGLSGFSEQSEDTEKEGAVKEIGINQLVPFQNHPFKLYQGARLDDMVRSVKELGVLSPLIVRTISGRFGTCEILAGHNRWNAGREAGLNKVPVVVMDGLSEEEAMLIVTETNLIQRSFSDLCHSERACVLAKHYEALKDSVK